MNTEDERLLSWSNMLLKILGLSKFLFHFEFLRNTLVSFSAECTDFQWLNFKAFFFFLLISSSRRCWRQSADFLKGTRARLFYKTAGEIHHMIITSFSANVVGEMLSPRTKWAVKRNWAVSVEVRRNCCEAAAEQTGPEGSTAASFGLSSRI